MSSIGTKAVKKLGWVCGLGLSIIGFVDLNKDPISGLIIIASIVICLTVIAKLLGKPLRSEIESGNFTTEEAKILIIKHPGVWLGAVASLIISFTV
ncbi:hypothetical protein [Colwellia sp. RSH04]|uniref:hypothetical protein n=1 Tax=Colwellia sp. RSH04 TaxID=2305464 RepID=UPI000E56D890|nr:hypothetical protein [Colwellia sp. RSH04]RHW74534.1 hypothetical protein D1094_18420 [Colwellia sp. RSH04]